MARRTDEQIVDFILAYTDPADLSYKTVKAWARGVAIKAAAAAREEERKSLGRHVDKLMRKRRR